MTGCEGNSQQMLGLEEETNTILHVGKKLSLGFKV